MKKLFSLVLTVLLALTVVPAALAETYTSEYFHCAFDLADGMTVTEEYRDMDERWLMFITTPQGEPDYLRIMTQNLAFESVDLRTADDETLSSIQATLDITFGDVGFAREVVIDDTLGTYLCLSGENGLDVAMIRVLGDGYLMADQISASTDAPLTEAQLAAHRAFLAGISNG